MLGCRDGHSERDGLRWRCPGLDGGMEVYEGRRIPLVYWDGRGLSPPPFILQADSNSWQHRFLDCPASAALTKEK